ncbi:Uncharacterized protein PECH_008334 [Penicillium ucsense]|uniref:Uncharacterized protein n=1 Tax=Penicillium ucsense TaxID=2839758 RepID=A0A8J8WFY2_9EURO|nr:Uncharacterized protein PECM_008156 [Penicillium ucsense]KAF7734233.1 Uncharacterized protein PECH_008334 [Penicillium ucsense]
MTTTPPPPSPSSLRTPSAPLHGAGYDQYDPYPPRKSTRLANQRAAKELEKLPEPAGSKTPSKFWAKRVPKQYRTFDLETSSDSDEFIPGQQLEDPFLDRGSSHDAFISPQRQSASALRPRAEAPQGLLTPAKTPSKRKIQRNMSSISRTLFPSSGRVTAKKPAPFSLESFETTSSEKIQIFTDSRDRVPVARPSADNPFASRLSDVSKTKTPIKGPAKTNVESRPTPETTVSDSMSRTRSERHRSNMSENKVVLPPRRDGMTMMFRGKRVFTKFEDSEDEDEDDDDFLGLFASRADLLAADPSALDRKPLSRREIKPRQLFPSVATGISKDEEEAATDDEGVQEPDMKQQSVVDPSVDTKDVPESLESPQAPVATRLLRSSARFASQIEQTSSGGSAVDTKRKRISPFDHWLRKKQAIEEVSASLPPAKREADYSGDQITPPSAKKTRNTRGSASVDPAI